MLSCHGFIFFFSATPGAAVSFLAIAFNDGSAVVTAGVGSSLAQLDRSPSTKLTDTSFIFLFFVCWVWLSCFVLVHASININITFKSAVVFAAELWLWLTRADTVGNWEIVTAETPKPTWHLPHHSKRHISVVFRGIDQWTTQTISTAHWSLLLLSSCGLLGMPCSPSMSTSTSTCHLVGLYNAINWSCSCNC